jgi:hypothetical protein
MVAHAESVTSHECGTQFRVRGSAFVATNLTDRTDDYWLASSIRLRLATFGGNGKTGTLAGRMILDGNLRLAWWAKERFPACPPSTQFRGLWKPLCCSEASRAALVCLYLSGRSI